MMSFNAGWGLQHPGYDDATGCIQWPESEWDAFLKVYADPKRAGYFYIRDAAAASYVGHVHYRLNQDDEAEIGINIIPSTRRQGLGGQALRLLLDRIWSDTKATATVNEFEDDRAGAVRLHQAAGFLPGAPATLAGRTVRRWVLHRPARAGASGCRPDDRR